MLSLLGVLSVQSLGCASDEDDATGTNDALSVTALGSGKGKLTTIFQDKETRRQPIDVDFNPKKPGEAWLVNFADDSVTILTGVGSANTAATTVSSARKYDPAASHFMHRPPALAMGQVVPQYGQSWATCGDGDNGGNFFMGPTLFSADNNVFARATSGGLGSHLDMLHLTSYCRGIAWEKGNVYWTFNAEYGSVERYDFVKDHGPGMDDHSDGTVYRYLSGQLTPANSGIPSHMAYHVATKKLFIADTGAGRVIALDTTSGKMGKQLALSEKMRDAREVTGASSTVVVKPGSVKFPSGLTISNDVLYVGDALSGKVSAFDLRGTFLQSFETGLTNGGLAGIRVGPDKKLYIVDRKSARLLRIDPK